MTTPTTDALLRPVVWSNESEHMRTLAEHARTQEEKIQELEQHLTKSVEAEAETVRRLQIVRVALDEERAEWTHLRQEYGLSAGDSFSEFVARLFARAQQVPELDHIATTEYAGFASDPPGEGLKFQSGDWTRLKRLPAGTKLFTAKFPTELTTCWDCGEEYKISARECPQCCAANGNVDRDLAMRQQKEKREGLSS